MSALVSFERVFEVLDLQPLIAERPDPVPLPPGPLSVEYDHVRFAYPSADRVSLASLEEVAQLDQRAGVEVLHGVSLRAEPGQLVALVGSSGAGKSTLAALLPRLYDVDAGAVRLGGVDVRDLSADAVRGAVGMVTQDGHLFHESVRANLALARPEAGEHELWEVLLARPRVVVLDEATAHLDSTSEAAVQAALAEALAGRTSLVIAHRLSTVRSADLILVVEDGRVVERGRHEELLALGGRYEELHRTQFAEGGGAVPVQRPR